MTSSFRRRAVPFRRSATDNFDYGRGAGIRAQVDLTTGTITKALRAAESGYGVEEVEFHRRTGLPILGERIPDWYQVRKLVELEAPYFYTIRLVGRDIAVTPEGPAFLEGNIWFDPGENACGEQRASLERFEQLSKL